MGLIPSRLQVALFPTRDIREIPDNQEVFVHSGTDQSIVIELLEHQIQVPDQEAARYHFADITSSNDATGVEGTEIFSVEPFGGDQIALQDPSSAWFLSGRQQVAKFNEQPFQQQHSGDGRIVFQSRPALDSGAVPSHRAVLPAPGPSHLLLSTQPPRPSGDGGAEAAPAFGTTRARCQDRGGWPPFWGGGGAFAGRISGEAPTNRGRRDGKRPMMPLGLPVALS
ncbi:ran guanine nucleotide release factor isoform X2 [Scyliorhinus torazame]|uniref:ran guanine nucleotide release factor isoform X2 n=1 Tax=Scyliorhinus torazame TaxID=75743 RepID=UPI003B5A1160